MNSNAFSAADMTTAAANGHRDGYQAGYADAVKAVEVGKPAAAQEAVWELAKKVRTELDRASCPDAFMRIAVEAVMEHADAPVALAPTLDAELAQDRMSELCELERDVLDSLPAVHYMDPPDGGNVSLGEQVKRMAEDAALWRKHSSTTAAPDDMHAHLLHMLGARDHEDAGRIIGELHAASMSTPEAQADGAILTNPYTGQPRDYRDVESDPAGTLIVNPKEPLFANNSSKKAWWAGYRAGKGLPPDTPRSVAASTPAAPGIDLEQFRPLIKLGMTWGPGSRYRIAAESLAALIDASPKGGSDAISVEGTVVFKRSEGAGKYCVCCPDSPAHIYGRHIEWEGKSRPDQNALDLAILEQVLYVSGNEGKRVRVTIDVLQATSAEVGS